IQLRVSQAGPRDSQQRIQFIDVAVSDDARICLADAASVNQRGLALVAALCVNTTDSHFRSSRKSPGTRRFQRARRKYAIYFQQANGRGRAGGGASPDAYCLPPTNRSVISAASTRRHWRSKAKQTCRDDSRKFRNSAGSIKRASRMVEGLSVSRS